MSRRHHSSDVLIVGGGPAGLAAACAAAQDGRRVTIVDDNPSPGGQVWRGESGRARSPEAAEWFAAIQRASVLVVRGARVFDRPEEGLLLAETFDGVYELSYGKLILATGARERFLPFPGWTLPNVMGAGGLQAFVKSGLSIRGERVVVAGSGPLLLAVAAYLRRHGADVRLIAEQAPWHRLARFGVALLRHPGKAAQALRLRGSLSGVPYRTGCWPIAAEGREKISRVTLRQGRRTWSEPCDYLACGFHLVPNLELALLLGCAVEKGGIRVDDYQETSVPGVYSAGESTGIGGLERALVEGQIAGYAAVGRRAEACRLWATRARWRRFAQALDRTFTLRAELKTVPGPDTIVCRCEDVPLGRLRVHGSWRAAKLQARCGMGPCQGRICGAALEFLLDWRPESVRPPIFPARLESLARTGSAPDAPPTRHL